MGKIVLAVIDNYPLIRESLVFSLQDMGFDVSVQSNLKDFMTVTSFAHQPLHACCLNMTSADAQSIALKIKAAIPGIKVIGYALNNIADQALLSAVDLYLPKSYSRKMVKTYVEQLCAPIDSG